MQKDRKYLFVTGASGFIGKNFIIKAESKGHKIFALSRFKRKVKSKNIVWIKGEIDDDFNNYLKKTHTMIHFAAAGVNNNNLNIREVFEENVFKPHKFLLSCLKNGCKKWIIIGSASEYGKSAEKKKELTTKTKELPESNYEKSKLIFSKLAFKISKYKKIKCRILRIFNVYGRGENKKKLLTSLKFSIKKKKNLQLILVTKKKTL